MSWKAKPLKTLSFVKRWHHHTQSGGYDRLAKYTDTAIFQTKEIPFIKAKERGFSKKFLQWLIPSSRYSNHYHFKDALAERKLMKLVKARSIDLIHAFYAEDQLNKLLSSREKLKAALVGTMHLPAESQFIQKLQRAEMLERYAKLDAIITLSTDSVKQIKFDTGNPNVFFVPHGIDTQIFKPNDDKFEMKNSAFKILTVGRHGRDWETYIEVVNKIKEISPEISFTAVVPEKISKKLKQKTDIETISSISESMLIELYRDTNLVYIPLTYATANNSILESLACGTPVISTNTGGIPDYVDKECGWLVPRYDVRETTELIMGLSRDQNVIRIASEAARNHSLQFDWLNVADQIHEIYHVAWINWKSKS